MEDKKIITVLDAETNEKVELELVEEINLNDTKYVLLAPVDNEEDAYIYKIVNVDGKDTYEMVDNEEEFNAVVAEYDKLFDETINE
ncbi:MAG: DUF1292 domain-containing protein [Clostridium argentinense]|uniref:DUF1292 domain-containing protein n=1 Tax=Clostridium faecium TaxID=2762223 RepID=A0ABR8YML3_9CLOT|nr:MULTISPECIES: DUF1292 domain-containing protein [Clostridium]MBD8045475.1 DUF1292 domain-containing protein [Clostridium faecium]MBS5824612.1 DUF1292 domain-containing protein [Clostridium argentinense]MDU1348904.1 DUF1292 domain-containing protein [Clostridium argentinense]